MKKTLITLTLLAGLCGLAWAGETAKSVAPASPSVSTTADFSKAAAARERITALIKQMNHSAVHTQKPRIKHATEPEIRMQYESIVLRDIQVEVNGSTATEHHIADVKGSYSKQPFAGTVRSTSTWQFRDGDWHMVSLSAQPAK